MKNRTQRVAWVVFAVALVGIYALGIFISRYGFPWDDISNKWIEAAIGFVMYGMCGGLLAVTIGGERRTKLDRPKLIVAVAMFIWGVLYVMSFFALTRQSFLLKPFILALYRSGILLTDSYFYAVVHNVLYLSMGFLAVRSFYEK